MGKAIDWKKEKEMIRIRGAAEHNLKHLDVDIPRNKLVVLTGLSGSGKSSLAFDTIYAVLVTRFYDEEKRYHQYFFVFTKL